MLVDPCQTGEQSTSDSLQTVRLLTHCQPLTPHSAEGSLALHLLPGPKSEIFSLDFHFHQGQPLTNNESVLDPCPPPGTQCTQPRPGQPQNCRQSFMCQVHLGPFTLRAAPWIPPWCFVPQSVATYKESALDLGSLPYELLIDSAPR